MGFATVYGTLFALLCFMVAFNAGLAVFVMDDAYNKVLSDMRQFDLQRAEENVHFNGIIDQPGRHFKVNATNLSDEAVSIVRAYVWNEGSGSCFPVCVSDDITSPNLGASEPDHLLRVNGIVINTGEVFLMAFCSSRGRCWADPYREHNSTFAAQSNLPYTNYSTSPPTCTYSGTFPNCQPPTQPVVYSYQFGTWSATKLFYSWDQNAGQLNWNFTIKNTASSTQTWTTFPDLWENQTITSAPFWSWYGPWTTFSCTGNTTLNPTQTSTILCNFHPFNPNPPPYPFPALAGIATTNGNCQPNLCGSTWMIQS